MYRIQIRLGKKVASKINSVLYSTQPAVQSSQEHYEKQIKDFEKISNITQKTRTKKPQKPPFAKNLFVGVFDTDILTYPQLEKNEVEDLENNTSAVSKLLEHNHMLDARTFDKNFRQNLADHRSIGLQASNLLNGRQCNATESTKFCEAFAQHNFGDSIIFNEQLGVQTLVKFGSNELKTKYLTSIMSGNSLSAFCLTESGLTDPHAMKTTAELSGDQKSYIINGEKVWVVNGNSADKLIVLALTKVITRDQMKEPKLTAFIVDKDMPGIVCKKHEHDLDIADITFNDTLVPVENIIGEVHKGAEIFAAIIPEFRLSYGASCSTLTKKLIKNFNQHILDMSTDSLPLHNTEAFQTVVGEIVTNLYAAESLTYLTSGLIDNYENQDCEVEAAIVKVFSSEVAYNSTVTCLDLIGSATILENHWCRQLQKHAQKYVSFIENNDNLRMTIALLGLQHAGETINDKIKMLRNPLYNAGFILKRMWTNRRNVEDNPKLNLELNNYLHPSLDIASKQLEYSVLRLEFATETLLARHGTEIVNKHQDLRRIANCIIDTYAMTAVIGRASRSYCIGLQHAEYEMMLANSFCVSAMERVKYNVKKIWEGYHFTNDNNYQIIAKRTFKFKEYFPKHPLTRNF